MVRKNDPDREIDKDGRMYKNFLGAKASGDYGLDLRDGDGI